MTKQKESFSDKVFRFSIPHVLVLILLIILFCCGLTYILPAGLYEIDPQTGLVVPNSFHWVENSPISPWRALVEVTNGVASQGVIFALLFIMGGLIYVVIESGAINNVINYSVYKLQDKSITVLVPAIVVLMSAIGALAGQDSLVTFVLVGLLLVKKLRLDKIAALSIFYLSYITGQAAGPTVAIILMAQETAGLAPISGLGARLVVWAALTLLCVIYTTRYCLKISKDPSRSILGCVEEPDGNDELNKSVPVLGTKDIVTALCMLVPFAFYAYGAAAYAWGFPNLIAFAMVAVIVVGIVNRTNPNELAVTFLKGASAMGGICLMIGFAKVVGIVLTDGKILHTIAYAAVTAIGGLGDAFTASGMFLFTTAINLLIPSGPAKVPMLIPLFVPVADVLGITRQVMCLAFQLGDGLTNFVTPVSAVLAAALSMSGVDLRQWWRYVLPYTGITFIIAIVALTILQSIGWS
ncbi:AbgT family transporter [Parasutterella secunda]|uniref:AbgT family transporter n=1 Tax=Parasutterella secunda TaxID=626947 RepID=UPI0025A36CCB|nr:AbgT family transporter [Parasutterella secunda]MDM8224740.1 AbgT family transporter [Parasutterella secunda]